MINGTNPTTTAANPAGFRLLRWNEMVKRGDFVEDGNQGFERWEGPSGFHAVSFVKTIYRKRRQARADKQ